MYVSDDSTGELFGEPIYSYGDDQAVNDGVLVALQAGTRPTPYRVSRGAWEDLKEYYKNNGYPEYGDPEFNRFLVPLRNVCNLTGAERVPTPLSTVSYRL